MVKVFKGEEDEYGFSITSKLEASFHIPLYSSCRKVTVMDLHKENSRVFVGDIVTVVAIVVSVLLFTFLINQKSIFCTL